MTIIKAIILGLIQGVTEFLPVSSSGHLAIAGKLMNMDTEGSNLLSFNILLHVATLAAVFIVYREDIFSMIKAFFAMVGDLFTGKGLGLNKDMYRRLVIMLVVGTIPAVIVALSPLGDLIENPTLLIIGIFLFITALLLFVSEKLGGGNKTLENMTVKDAVIVGCFQALGTMPGISRSGSTIVGGLFSKLDKNVAVRFSFLLSIPAILGAMVLDIKNLFEAGANTTPISCIIVGMIVAGVSGYFAIKFLLDIVRRRSLSIFSVYCTIVGAMAIILNFVLN